jgi:neopullulanase
MKLAFALLAGVTLCHAQAPLVSKIEPPSWTAGAHSTTLRILLTGQNLSGARIKPCPALAPARNELASENGSYLFFDLTIPAEVRPGVCALAVSSSGGRTSVPFSLTKGLDPKRNFQGFSSDDVIYLIMTDRFANGDTANDAATTSPGLIDRSKSRYYHGGDFAGIQQRLSYLKDLGVTAIWLTPVYDNADRLNERERYDNQATTDYHGYGAVDFYKVDEHFGTVDSFRQLVDAAHGLGIKIIQDQVANHTGPYHPWVQNPPASAWFHGTEKQHPNETWLTWTLLDPHATAEMRRGTLDGWFANILPDLNQDDTEVARYLIQNSLWWVGQTGIDGIREDTVPYVPRTFWRKWSGALHDEFPKLRIVGEVFDQDPSLAAFYQGGREGFDGIDTGLDTVFDFPLFYAIRRFFAQHGPALELSKIVAHDSLYPDSARLVTFLGLHDVPRFMNEKGATFDDLADAFTFLFSVRGTPMIYYGDEIGMQGGDDPDNRRDFPGGWREDTKNAFEASGRSPEENRLFDHIRHLAAVRKKSTALRNGQMLDLLGTEHSYAFARIAGSERILAVFHEGPDAEAVRIPVRAAGFEDGSRLTDALGKLPPIEVTQGSIEMYLPARSAALYVSH